MNDDFDNFLFFDASLKIFFEEDDDADVSNQILIFDEDVLRLLLPKEVTHFRHSRNEDDDELCQQQQEENV